MPPLQQFRVREKLLRILKMAGATEKFFTTKQIISYLGQYIEQRKLFDTLNVRTVCCRGDLLEDLFGVQVFTIGNFKDIWQFVFPYLVPATNREIQEHEHYNKSKQDVATGSNDSGTVKMDRQWMSQLPWWYFVEKDVKDTEGNYDKATASGSFVETSTAYVVDTEYESNSTNDSRLSNIGRDEDKFSEEYEPDSDENDTDSTEPLESDEEQYPLIPRVDVEPSEETTTTDTTDVSMDFDMPLEDHWRCEECSTLNPPIVGYCQRCWKLRKGWLPDTSLSSPGLLRSHTLPAGEFCHNFTPMLTSSSSQPNPIERGIDVADGTSSKIKGSGGTSSGSNFHDIPFNSGKRKQDLSEVSAPAAKIRNIAKVTPHSDCGATTSKLSPSNKINISHSATTSSDTTVQGSFSTSSSAEQPKYSLSVPGLCNICHNNPNDATIVHGKFGHQYCCYRCAKKLKKRGKTCPVCRQPIAYVVKNYICQM